MKTDNKNIYNFKKPDRERKKEQADENPSPSDHILTPAMGAIKLSKRKKRKKAAQLTCTFFSRIYQWNGWKNEDAGLLLNKWDAQNRDERTLHNTEAGTR